MNSIVFQSYRRHDVAPWIGRCLDSVRSWAKAQGHDYLFIDDRLFDLVPDWYRKKARGRIPIITDLGRLIAARDLLGKGYRRAIWIDADVLVFDPERFRIPLEKEYAFCWEIWVKRDEAGALSIDRNTNNAVCAFCRGNSLLDFYIHACQAILESLTPDEVPAPAIVGTQFLTSLYSHLRFPLLTNVGLLSPPVLLDVAAGGGPALEMQRANFGFPARAANLCASLHGQVIDGIELDDALFGKVLERLLAEGTALLNPAAPPQDGRAKSSSAIPPR